MGTDIGMGIRFHGRIRDMVGNPRLAEVLGGLQDKSRLAMHSLRCSEVAARLCCEITKGS